MPLGVIVGGKF